MPWAARRSSTPGVRHVVFRKVGAGSRSVRNPSGPSPPTAELAKEAWISTSVAEDAARLSLGPRPGKSLGKLPQRERSSRRHQMKYQIPTLRTGTSLARSTLRNSMYRLILSMPPGRLMRAAIFPPIVASMKTCTSIRPTVRCVNLERWRVLHFPLLPASREHDRNGHFGGSRCGQGPERGGVAARHRSWRLPGADGGQWDCLAHRMRLHHPCTATTASISTSSQAGNRLPRRTARFRPGRRALLRTDRSSR